MPKGMEKIITFDTPVQFVKGVGPKISQLLGRRGILTVRDLLWELPRTYELQELCQSISELKVGMVAILETRVLGVQTQSMGPQKQMCVVWVGDAGGRLACRFFKIPFRGFLLPYRAGTRIVVVGKVTDNRGQLEMIHPELQVFGPSVPKPSSRVIPIYSESEGLTSAVMARLIRSCLSQVEASPGGVPPDLPSQSFPQSRLEMFRCLHLPSTQHSAQLMAVQTPAQMRFKGEEALRFLLPQFQRRLAWRKQKAFRIQSDQSLANQVLRRFQHPLTASQEKVLDDIRKDLNGLIPMNRLVQGDVGSGKSIVALLSACEAIQSGCQVAFMAPTEILAAQLFQFAKEMFHESGVEIALLTGSASATQRSSILSRLGEGKIHLLVGTHSLFEEGVDFHFLQLVIIDEQHRFGVQQRMRLRNKGEKNSASHAHILMMSATPIPRTLALATCGDISISSIRELPPGRTPVKTFCLDSQNRSVGFQSLREEVSKGRQAYVVYPRIEEGATLRSAEQEFVKLKAAYPEIRFGLLHGKMSSETKSQVMEDFRIRNLDVLVTTTVIEVGVSVANATVLIVENAERFGLAQLHQLRGRVGRGDFAGQCFLLAGEQAGPEGLSRLKMLEKTSDGFEVADLDLQLRGAGDLTGQKQAGFNQLRLADPVQDPEVFRQAALYLEWAFQEDPELRMPCHQELLSWSRRLPALEKALFL